MANRDTKTAPAGLILLHKRPGLTSFDSLKAVKRALETGKAGHTGTLDKFAEGLLLVLTGKALKLSQWFTHCDKQYEGTIRFGVETDTLDPEGAEVARAPLPSRQEVEEALGLFRGKIGQAPPAYSAIHIGGERASVLARRGEAPEMKKRPVEVYRLELRSWDPPLAGVFVHCSGGTYIRSLARDIALAAGSRAHLAGLLRTRVARFGLEDAVSPEAGVVPRPVDRAVFDALGLPCLEADPEAARGIAGGRPLRESLDTPTLNRISGDGANAVAVFSGDRLLAVVERPGKGEPWKYGYVYARD
ncbi:MAG: tRNA pseudouridine(55) synthase TruB [Treponema sp.]|nr:tRNA pseudouridine(55) synthase TruB [Treponema sp.]